MDAARNSTCPSDEELAAWLDGGLDADRREAVAAHAVACDDCRLLLAEGTFDAPSGSVPLHAAGAPGSSRSSGTRAGSPGSGRRAAVGAALIAAAAVLLFVVVPDAEVPIAGPTVRAPAGSQDAVVLPALTPAADARIPASALRFEWAAAATGTVYVLSVLDERGAVLWSVRTDSTQWMPSRDSAAALPPDVPIYWRVEALLPDLSTAATPLTTFRITPP